MLRFLSPICPKQKRVWLFFKSAATQATLQVANYERHAIVDACHRTNDGQEHKVIWCAGSERDTIFHLGVTACRG